jgi:beta-glucanase (GH16 family)
MRSTILSATAVALGAFQLVEGQTFTDCNPTQKVCPADPGLGKTITTDFTTGASSDYTLADGTTMKYDGTNGAEFIVNVETDAPTITSSKYIFFGKVEVVLKACKGTGLVSSFVLESDDLDEIDWEWLGYNDSSVETNYFGKGYTGDYNRADYYTVADVQGTWHTYTVDWTSSYVKWSVDGNVLRTLNYADAVSSGNTFPQTPMRIKMGNWVAGGANSSEGTREWAGGYTDFSQAPFTMYVKSVTIQDYGCGGNYTYTDETGSYQSIASSGSCSNNTLTSASGSSSSTASSSSKATAQTSISGSVTGTATGTGSVTTKASAATTATASGNSSGTSSSKGSSGSSASGTSSLKGSSGSSASGTSTTSSGSALSTTSSGNTLKPKHKYGVLDFGVTVLGLGLGYLVM